MFFKKFDMLSPPITLYFKGDNTHPSIFSGILSVIAYAIILSFGIYYALEFINKENPTAFFFNRYIEDAGEFPLNASSMFHYIELTNIHTNEEKPIDFDMIRIVGVNQITIDSFHSTNLEITPHWIYGLCSNKDTGDIGDLITTTKFENCACIKKYYEPNKKKYYNIDNENFLWPTIAHGMSNKNGVFYGFIIEKCKNDNLRKLSGLGNCKNNEIINNYIFSHILSVYMIDHFSDVLNYKVPFRKYMYSIRNQLFPKSYTVNNMNFNPAIIKTHNGIIFDSVLEEFSYFYQQNEKVTLDEEIEVIDEDGNPTYDEDGNKVKSSTGIVSSLYFFMQNGLQYYERNYKRLQDVLGDIGGLSSIVLLIAETINSLVSSYVILLDTEELSLSINENNSNKDKLEKKPIIFKKSNEITNPPKRKYNYSIQNNNQLPSYNQKFIKEGIDIYQNIKIENENDEKYKNLFLKRNEILKDYYSNNKKVDDIKVDKNNNKYTKRIFELRRKENEFKENKIKNINYKIITRQKDLDEAKIINEKQDINWFKYIRYIICCKRRNSKILYYEEHRAQIISEESIIQDHLDLYKLIDICKLDTDKINSYRKSSKL